MQQPHRLSNLTGYRLLAQDGGIGKLKQIYFDDQYWIVRYFAVHTGLWLTGKDVLIMPSLISNVDEKSNGLSVELSREKIQYCPPVDTALPISRQYEQDFFHYYGLKPYWNENPPFGRKPVPSAHSSADDMKPENSYLHSSEDIKGFHIHTLDGEIGHVEDIILEAPEWTIRYLEVDIRNPLFGKKVLVSPTWFNSVDWSREAVFVDLTKESIESAPAYDPAKVISRNYQVALYEHYGKTFHHE